MVRKGKAYGRYYRLPLLVLPATDGLHSIYSVLLYYGMQSICCGTKKVNPCPDNQASRDQPVKEDDRGDILLHGFWARGTDCIVDVRVTDTDAKSYQLRGPANALKSVKKRRRRICCFNRLP
jgi:hypothetical protein